MNTRLLETLFAIRDAGSIAGAARRLNISTAAVAERIHLLEQELQTRIIVRSGRTVSLTPGGMNILPHAEDILKRVRELRHHAAPHGLHGLLQIGATSSTLANLFPGLIQRVTKDYPDIELVVVPGTSAYLFERVSRGEISCAVIGKPPFPLGKAFSWTVLRREYLVLLTRWDDPIEPPEKVLASRPLIRVDSSAWTGHIITQFLQELDFNVRVLLEIDAFEVMRNLVTRGVGVVVQPDWGIVDGPATGLRKTRVGSDRLYREIGLLSRSAGGEQNLIDLIVKILRDEVALQEGMLTGAFHEVQPAKSPARAPH